MRNQESGITGSPSRSPCRRTCLLLFAVLWAALLPVCRGADPVVDLEALSQFAARRAGVGDVKAETGRLRDLLERNPWDEGNWARLGWARLAAKDAPDAEACVLSSLRIRPYHARHMILLAYCRVALGKVEGTGEILACAQQSSVVPFNQIQPKDVTDLLARVLDDEVRRAIEEEMRAAMATNTFLLERSRADILTQASGYGRVLFTRREPHNKGRLWIAFEGRFLQVFDEEKDAFEDHAPLVAQFVLDRSTPGGLAFTAGHLVAAVEGRLVQFDSAAGVWRPVSLPAEIEETRVPAVDTFEAHRIRAVFRGQGKGDPGVTYFYAPAEGQWTPDEAEANHLALLSGNARAWAFGALRYGAQRDITPFEAACALSQWADLAAYVGSNAPGEDPTKLVGPEGRLVPEELASAGARRGAPTGPRKPYFKGVTLPAWWWRSLATPESLDALGQIRALGGEWVSLTPTRYQNDPLSVEIMPDAEKTASMESLEHAIWTAHQLGLKVLLKPHLNLLIEDKDNHMWRGMIKPRSAQDVAAWFGSYEAFLAPYVDLAVRQNVEMVAVGVELKSMVGHQEHWRELISRVRQRGYAGKLTYAALHESFDKVRFWDALDYVGIDAYFGATSNPRASLAQIIRGHKALAERLSRFSAAVGKPVIFTEVGFNNLDGCNARPWFWSGNPAAIDNLEQALCYQAVLETFPRQDWFAGMFWWSWSPSGPPLPQEPSYSPQSKLAELILEAYYRQPQAE